MPLLGFVVLLSTWWALEGFSTGWFITGCVFISAFYVQWKRTMFKRNLCLAVAFVAVAFAGWAYIVDESNQTIIEPDVQKLTGVVVSDVQEKNDNVRFVLKSEEFAERVQVVLNQTNARVIQRGEQCTVRGTLRQPMPRTVPNAFDYKTYLYDQKIHWEFISDEMPLCEPPPYLSVSWLFYQLREKGMRHLEEHVPARFYPYAKALLYGDRSSLSPEIQQMYNRYSISHLLSISGLHVGVMSALFFISLTLFLTRETSLKWLLFILPVYAFFTGAEPPVIRAVLKAEIVILWLLFFRKRLTSVDGVTIAFLAMVLWNPYMIKDVAFQLSFTVTYSLLFSLPLLKKLPSHWALQSFAIATIAQLSGLPILLFHFYEISLLSPLWNILFVPLYTVVMLPASVIIFFVSFLPLPLSLWLAQAALYIIDLAHGLLQMGDVLYDGVLLFGKPPLWLAVIEFFAVTYAFQAIERYGFVRRGLLYSAPLIILLTVHYFQWELSANGRVAILDVGQGDSIVIELPYRQGVLLIDAGGSFSETFDPGEQIVVPYLRSRGIRQLDAAILSHSDLDHAGGMKAILQQISTKQLIIPQGKSEEGELIEMLKKEATAQQAIVTIVEKNRRFTHFDTAFLLIPSKNEHFSENNQSLVIKAVLGNRTWLFTGDIEEEREEELKAQNLKADVLKIAHHGSRTSSSASFLEAVSPQWAVISAGRNNRFNHPHEEVLERLRHLGISVWRTDLHGTLIFNFN
ncbi:DNA internalization-related competence protein ComEC/Rec2 [Litoribacterium kuwaitense]|uniref:DNA internalization-related competence protein ComEC/Rec2 n=1 Tax=Litoribacterium kuwaitense TaxID=1398745 RepID=UPI001FEA0B19|nr:DNA internalization-related competence protein ComEC/Rec2 [Litoribacterium kuwaitense]